jgi:hypothetical protein
MNNAPRRRPRRFTRIAALLAPWIVALAVLAAAPHTTGTTPVRDTGGRDATPAPAPSHAAPAPSASADATAPADATAAAVRLVRDAVTGRRSGVTTAIDVAVPEEPEALGADQWLIRVHAVVLRGDARRWRSAVHEVWAVPIGISDGHAIALEEPWPVANEHARVTPGRWDAEAVDEAAVRSTLRAAGMRPAPDLAAERHPQIPHVIRVRVAGPGARHVWLRTTPSMHVLGAGAEAVE